LPAYRSLFESLGFEEIPGAEAPNWLAEVGPFAGYVLDLRQIGFERWIEAIVAGRRPPRSLSPETIASALEQALKEWWDDAVLAESPLLESALVSSTDVARPGPNDVRRAIRGALEAGQASASARDRLAYHALELAYLGQPAPAAQIAERLAVSRATLYRQLKRGVELLAATLSARLPRES
jgi:hypothetical protein